MNQPFIYRIESGEESLKRAISHRKLLEAF